MYDKVNKVNWFNLPFKHFFNFFLSVQTVDVVAIVKYNSIGKSLHDILTVPNLKKNIYYFVMSFPLSFLVIF